MTTRKKLLKKRYGTNWNKGEFIYEPTGPYSNELRAFAAENELKVYEVNPTKSANVAKVLGNRSKIDAIDAKMLSTFHALLTEGDFRIPEIDEITEQLGALIGNYEILQKTRGCSPTTCLLWSTKAESVLS